MDRLSPATEPANREPARLVVPAGTPAWITPELLEQTIATWQPYYQQPLTVEGALEILIDVGRLFTVLEDPRHEKALSKQTVGEEVSGSGPRLQS